MLLTSAPCSSLMSDIYGLWRDSYSGSQHDAKYPDGSNLKEWEGKQQGKTRMGWGEDTADSHNIQNTNEMEILQVEFRSIPRENIMREYRECLLSWYFGHIL